MEVARSYKSYRQGLGPWRAAWLYEKDAVLALREHHLSQGMQTIWDSQSQQRLIVDHDEHGDLARIMVVQHRGPRGIGIDPYHAHVMRDTTGGVVRAGDVWKELETFALCLHLRPLVDEPSTLGWLEREDADGEVVTELPGRVRELHVNARGQVLQHT